MQRSLAIVALLIIAYLFTKMHQTQCERSTIGIWTTILVYVAVFEAADLIATLLKNILLINTVKKINHKIKVF